MQQTEDTDRGSYVIAGDRVSI